MTDDLKIDESVDKKGFPNGLNLIDDAYINRTLASKPTWALWIIGLVIFIGIAAIVYQNIAFQQTPTVTPMPLQTHSQLNRDDSPLPLSRHQAEEKLFWIITNIELLVPGAITAILAWLTYSLISKTIVALELTRRQANAADSALTEQRKETLLQHEPYVSVNAFSVLVKATQRAFFKITNLYFPNIDENINIYKLIEGTTYLDQGIEKDLQESQFLDRPETISLVTSWTITVDITNVGLGAAHTIRVRARPFTWTFGSVLDPDDKRQPFRKVQFEDISMNTDQSFGENEIPIEIEFSRELTVLPANGRQTLTLEAKTWPRVTTMPSSSSPQFPTLYYPCDGIDLEINYRSFGSDEERSECTSIYLTESGCEMGHVSTLSVDHIETYQASNPVFGIDSNPIFRYDFRPIDCTGEKLIAGALRVAVFIALLQSENEDLKACLADSRGYAKKWIQYDEESYYDHKFRRFIRDLIIRDDAFAASVDAFVSKEVASEYNRRLLI